MTLQKIIVRRLSSVNIPMHTGADSLNKPLFDVPIKNGPTNVSTKKNIGNGGLEQKPSLKKLLSDLAGQSNVHGVSYLAGSKSAPLKCVWTVAFLGLLSFAVYQLYTIGMIYYSYPVKTNVKMEFKPLPFPAITICNMNTIRMSKIHEIKSETLQQILNGTYEQPSPNYSTHGSRQQPKTTSITTSGRTASSASTTTASSASTTTASSASTTTASSASTTTASSASTTTASSASTTTASSASTTTASSASTTTASSASTTTASSASTTTASSASTTTASSASTTTASSASTTTASSASTTTASSASTTTASSASTTTASSASTTTASSASTTTVSSASTTTASSASTTTASLASQSTSYPGSTFVVQSPRDTSRSDNSTTMTTTASDPDHKDYGFDSDFWDYWDYGVKDTNYDYSWDLWQDYYSSPLNHDATQYEYFLKEYLQIDRKEKKEVGHQLKNMLLDCQFNGRKCDPSIKDVVTYEYGNCFTIQSSKFIAGSTGPRSGMVLTINLENHEAVEDLTEGYGMRMVVHEPKSFPLPLEEGLTVSGGYETSIGLKMTRIERKGQPYGTCVDPKEYFKQNGIRFSTQACIQQCWENLAYARCDCQVGNVHSEIGRFNDQTEVKIETPKGCFTESEKRCSIDVRRDLLSDMNRYCDCPQPCLENTYTTTFSGRIWPHDTKLSELTDQACKTYELYNTTGGDHCDLRYWHSLSNNFLKVNIYFEDLNYEVISEEPLYDATQLISDVGGSLGLCLGASLLCICEVFEALVMIVVVMVRKIRGRSTVSEVNLERTSLDEFRSSKA
ncbi:degenerin deg-1-like [Mytilus trossulus]|uniref:degenerin deg-1-like n=1 Tax=Mytilus trossulus TaxID=6551 RepID=UPI00300525AA